MNATEFVSGEISAALTEVRPSFLGKKLTIDDVSRDIRLLEKQLNDMGARDDFSFSLGQVVPAHLGRQVEDYHVNAPYLERYLVWKQHGENWVLHYRVVCPGWNLFTFGQFETSDAIENRAIDEAFSHETMGTVLGIADGIDEVIFKPLIDMRAEVRFRVHTILPEFVRAFASDWQTNKYQRAKLLASD